MLWWNNNLPEGVVSLKGLDAMIEEFCGGIGEYSHDDLREVFNLIDRFDTGYIDREDFDAFLLVLTKTQNKRNSTKSKELASQIDKMMSAKSFAQRTMHGMSRPYRRSTSATLEDSLNVMQSMILRSEKGFVQDWTIFYCGGSDGIKKNLKDIAKKYGLAFAVEKFDW